MAMTTTVSSGNVPPVAEQTSAPILKQTTTGTDVTTPEQQQAAPTQMFATFTAPNHTGVAQFRWTDPALAAPQRDALLAYAAETPFEHSSYDTQRTYWIDLANRLFGKYREQFRACCRDPDHVLTGDSLKKHVQSMIQRYGVGRRVEKISHCSGSMRDQLAAALECAFLRFRDHKMEELERRASELEQEADETQRTGAVLVHSREGKDRVSNIGAEETDEPAAKRAKLEETVDRVAAMVETHDTILRSLQTGIINLTRIVAPSASSTSAI